MNATYYYVTCLGCAIDPDGKFRQNHGLARRFASLAEAVESALPLLSGVRILEVSGRPSDPHGYTRTAAQIDCGWTPEVRPVVTYA